MSAYAWIKLIHISAIAVWSAGLLYLPALFAAHARVGGRDEYLRVRRMTRMVFILCASPAAIVAVISGALLVPWASVGGWLVVKLAAVAALTLLHVYCGKLVSELRGNPHMRTPRVHLLLIVPGAMLVVAIFYLVLAKPW